MKSLKQFITNWHYRLEMAKKEIESDTPEQKIPAPRYTAYFIDTVTQVQIGAATDDLDKFTKTDLMKMVAVFKEEVQKENAKWEKPKNESNKRGNSKMAKRVRRSRKIPKS